MENNLSEFLSRELIEKGLYQYRDVNFSLEDIGVTDPKDLDMMSAWGAVAQEDLVAVSIYGQKPKNLVVTPKGREHLNQAIHIIR